MKCGINLDMDGTIANFYGVSGWLDCLEANDPKPYAEAKPLCNFSQLARQLNRLQSIGYKICIISWLSKSGTPSFNATVTATKYKWLADHLPSVNFDEIHIVPYGTPKSTYGSGILFDDEERNRKEWASANNTNLAFNVENILEILKKFR